MSHKPAHLLLVDDDPGLLKLLGLRLTSEGYSVVTAESGVEGLRVLNREKVDLVISDLRMDEMDGMQLFAEIQKVQPGMPVIILTAHGSIPDAVAATQQGVFSFPTKPVDKDALYQAIDDALEQSAPATDERWREAIVTRSPLMLRLLEQARPGNSVHFLIRRERLDKRPERHRERDFRPGYPQRQPAQQQAIYCY